MADAALATVDDASLLKLISDGDCSKLNDQQKMQYYKARCDAAGVDPRSQPFQFIKMGGKLVLYATKECSAQLSLKHGIICEVVDQKTEDDVRTVTVRAKTKDGEQTDDVGCLSVAHLKGEALANAYMKAVTKAKRRAILSVCGLGMIDETEIHSIPDAEPVVIPEEFEPVEIEAIPPAPVEESAMLSHEQQEKLKGFMGYYGLNKDDMKALCGGKSLKEISPPEYAKIVKNFTAVKDGKAKILTSAEDPVDKAQFKEGEK